MPERSLLPVLGVAALLMGLAGLHLWFGAPVVMLLLTLPAALILGALWLGFGWVVGLTVGREGVWWPRRSPCNERAETLAGLGGWLRDLGGFFDAHWTLAALVIGGCLLAMPLAPFCFLSWWAGLSRGVG